MLRVCSHCHRPFTRDDFVKEESKGMEAERKALGLEGEPDGQGGHWLKVDRKMREVAPNR